MSSLGLGPWTGGNHLAQNHTENLKILSRNLAMISTESPGDSDADEFKFFPTIDGGVSFFRTDFGVGYSAISASVVK